MEAIKIEHPNAYNKGKVMLYTSAGGANLINFYLNTTLVHQHWFTYNTDGTVNEFGFVNVKAGETAITISDTRFS